VEGREKRGNDDFLILGQLFAAKHFRLSKLTRIDERRRQRKRASDGSKGQRRRMREQKVNVNLYTTSFSFEG